MGINRLRDFLSFENEVYPWVLYKQSIYFLTLGALFLAYALRRETCKSPTQGTTIWKICGKKVMQNSENHANHLHDLNICIYSWPICWLYVVWLVKVLYEVFQLLGYL